MSKSYINWIPSVLSIAAEASRAIYDIQQSKSYSVKSKSDNSPVTEADLLAHQIIEKGLTNLDPSIPVISEEGEFVPFDVRSLWPRFWLVDPLDGTREFIRGSGEYTVNIALIENHIPVLGVVSVPNLEQQYWAVRANKVAFTQIKGSEPQIIQVSPLHSPVQVLVSHRFDPQVEREFLSLFNTVGGSQLIHCGSSLKICLVAEGKADLYPQRAKTSEWDTAPGQCILEAAGGQLLDASGQVLSYNTQDSQVNSPFYAIGDNKLASIFCG